MPVLSALKGFADAVLGSEAVSGPARRRHSGDLAVLAYHQVENSDTFARHLDHITTRYTAVSLAEIVTALEENRPLGDRSVLITFDDGDRSVLDVAAPLLSARGIPAVAFVVTSLLGTDSPFWWDEASTLVRAGATASGVPTDPANPAPTIRALKLCDNTRRLDAIAELRTTAPTTAPRVRHLTLTELAELERAGVAIGNHTHTHPCLDHCDEDTIESEIRAADAVIEGALGHRPTAFAYPNGDVDDRVTEVLQRCGHQIAFTFDHRVASWPPPDPLRISRVRVDASVSLDRFRAIVAGVHPALHRLRGGT